MRVGKKKNRDLLRAVLMTAVIGSSGIAPAVSSEPLNRFGRMQGFGWSDGYHACSSSGVRICADLPPKSYASKYGKRTGGTFYDRFDAANGRGCHACNGAGCDGAGCDGAGCDGCGCDGVGHGGQTYDGTVTIIQGSEVTRGLQSVPESLPTAPAPLPAQPYRNAEPPTLNSPEPAPPIAVPKPDAQANSSLPGTKKYPIRPQQPESFTPRTITFPAAAKQPTFGSDPFTVEPSAITPSVDPTPRTAAEPDTAYRAEPDTAYRAEPDTGADPTGPSSRHAPATDSTPRDESTGKA